MGWPSRRVPVGHRHVRRRLITRKGSFIIHPESRGEPVPPVDDDSPAGGVLRAPTESTVVLVDDALEVRYLIRILLANVRLCHVVGEAENGREAIDVVARLKPDVVILDVHMPVMGGLEALPQIAAVSPATRVIVYSSMPEAKQQALALGAFRYLDKGADPQRLVEAVREAVLA